MMNVAEMAVPVSADVRVTVTGELTHLCPFKDEVDFGRITVSWTCAGATLELHTLRSQLDRWADTVVSHEELTRTIERELSQVPGITEVAVSTQWDTAGFQVGVTSEVPRDGVRAERA